MSRYKSREMPKSIGEEVITELAVEGEGSPHLGENSCGGQGREAAGVFEGWQEVLVFGQRVLW